MILPLRRLLYCKTPGRLSIFKDNRKVYQAMKPITTCPTCGSKEFLRESIGVMVCRYCRNRYDEKTLNGAVLTREEIDAQVAGLLLRSEEYRSRDNYEEEIRVLSEASAIAPDSCSVWLKLGRAYRMLGMSPRALECYEKARGLEPDNGVAYTNTGAVYCAAGDYETACRWYEQGLSMMGQLDPDYPGALGNYALSLGMMGKKRKAVGYLKMAKQRGHESADKIKNLLGISWLGMLLAIPKDFDRSRK